MTANQIANRQQEEQARSNRANESIKDRTLAETKRSNREREKTEKAKTAIQGLGTLFGKRNDPSWYNLDKQLVKDVASISYGQPLGSPIRGQLEPNRKQYVPGMLGIHFIPTIGVTGATDNIPINVAAKNIYAYVRYANSGARNYEAVDLMLYILAMDNAYMQLQFAKTLYSVALTAKGENWYYGKAMLRLMLGTDAAATDILDNLAQFRSAINIFAMRLNSFYVPNTMPIVLRHSWLCGNIFKDHDIKKSQTYHFIPEIYYTYNDTDGKLDPNFTPYSTLGTEASVASITTMFNTIINALTTSEDIGIMSGDILKAYGEGKILFAESINEDFHIEATYSAEVLSQINAATLAGSCDDGAITDFSVDIYQDASGNILMGNSTSKTNTIVIPNRTNPIPASVNFQWNPLVVNMYKDDVTPDDTMVATRLMAILSKSSTAGSVNVDACGTELCLYANMVYQYGSNVVSESFNWGECFTVTENTVVSTYQRYLRKFTEYAKFDWAPRICAYLDITSKWAASLLPQPFYDSIDLANYASIDEETLTAMHGVALLSEFGVPLLGTTVRTR